MSYSKNYWKPPTGNQRQRELWWTNNCYYSHEAWCGCGHFGHHLLGAITGIPPNLLIDTTRNLELQERRKLCRSTAAIGTGTGEGQEPTENTGGEEERGLIDGLDEGELERLFEDPDMGAEKPPEG